MDLPEALKRLRKLRGIPQNQIASAAGVSTTQYQNYEYGKSEPTASVLIALADYFDVSLDYLVGRSDDSARPRTCSQSPDGGADKDRSDRRGSM